MKPLICNLKMNFNVQEILKYKEELNNIEYDNLIICPSYIYLTLMHSSNYKVCAQDISKYSDAFHTGEVSAKSLKSIDVNMTLIGHADRHDSYESKVEKIKMALKENMKAYVILSDKETDYNYQYTSTKLLNQIRGILSKVPASKYKNIIFIYEPSWLIGQSKPLLLSDTENILRFMKQELKEDYHHDFPFYYGGGLTLDTINDYYFSKDIDGLLLGSLSKDIKNVIKNIEKKKNSSLFDKTIQN